MRFRIPNNTKCYGGVSDTNTNSTKYTLETPNNPKYKFFWLFGTPNCYALLTIVFFSQIRVSLFCLIITFNLHLLKTMIGLNIHLFIY